FYKRATARAVERVGELGPVLGPYHPVVADNVQRLKELSGLDEVSFHMSGTEAVMQAVRLARYHTRRSHLVRFCGAYHGWWGDVQPGVGNPISPHETYTLSEMSERTLGVLRSRRDIACVLVNPLQALHPNGKTLAGGLPIGVICGRKDLMRRFRDDRPVDVCFARGTFNSHPYVMLAMDEFLTRLNDAVFRSVYDGLDATWNARARELNERLAARNLPVRVSNLSSIWMVHYTEPSRYNWMLQYYLRAEGLALSWVGTGRLIFSLNYTAADFATVADAFVAADEPMRRDGRCCHRPQVSNRTI